jgi:sporulation integral membrane protein YtvI
MPRFRQKSLVLLAGGFLLAWLALKYVLPLAMPFLLGLGLALAAEPLVGLLSKGLKRGFAAAIGVSTTLLLLTGVLVVLAAALLRELGLLAGVLPDLGQTAQSGLSSLEGFLLEITRQMPDGVQPLLTRSVSGFFSNGSALLGKLLQRLSVMASAFLGSIPGGALTVGTGILSGFMLSARFPYLKQRLAPLGQRLQKYQPMILGLKRSVFGWLKAQLTLSGVCFCIVAAGLFLLRVPYAPIWALVISLVDAIPVLGTGVVLLPWALVAFLQGNRILALGLGGVYLTAMLSRSVLEPRLVGKHLGIDPLMTLMALYVGYRIWGFVGMLLSPMLCAVATEAAHFHQ